MEKGIKIFYEPMGNTLHIWFSDPTKEYTCEETGEETILIKDAEGKLIGIEKLNYLSADEKFDDISIPVETKIFKTA